MRRRPPDTIKISRTDQQELKRLLGDGRTQQRVVRRAQVLLATKNLEAVVDESCQKVQMTRVDIWYLCRRYEKVGPTAIYDAARSGRPREISTLERAAIEQLACSEPSGGGLEVTHWSARSLAKIASNQTWFLTLHIPRCR